MKKLVSSVLTLFLLVCFSANSWAGIAFGDMLIQVDLPMEGDDNDGCSILRVTPQGDLSEFITNSQILNLTGNLTADCDDSGLTVGANSNVYFNEDTSDNIFIADPLGNLGIFITDNTVESLPEVTETVDWDNGLTTNPVTNALLATDEDNEILFEFPTDVPTPITDTSLITILATESDFLALVDTVNLEGGIAVDDQENVYITNDGDSDDDSNVLFKLTKEGDLSILCTNDDFVDAGGGPENVDLDIGIVLQDGKLYVGDDGDCDCVYEVDPVGCNPSIFITEDEIIAVTGDDDADIEGGVCADFNNNLFLGNDGGNEEGDPNDPNILFASTADPSDLAIYVSDNEIDAFYAVQEPGSNPRLRGSCDFTNLIGEVPTLSEWGLIATAAVLGFIGFIAIRRRKATA